MGLKIRCSSCRRGTSGKHSLCSDCRASSSTTTQTTVYVAESGERIEVITTERSSRSSRSNHGKQKSCRTSADRHGESSYPSHDAAFSSPSHAAGYQNISAESYREAGRYLGRDERDVEWDIANGYPYASYDSDPRQGHNIPGVAYVRPRVHPYEDRYEYISANMQYVYPSQTGEYTGTTQGGYTSNVLSSHAGHRQPPSGGYYPQSSPAPGPQASGQGGEVNYVYSGTEGPDGEVID
ncbi:hypothetical protein F5883DRAFT_642746 [Diaporthe sp. PMI_573]|nr:hypothetical protein F5883DRAFT_642746 [Diaporthaceae sp. PMI_573]